MPERQHAKVIVELVLMASHYSYALLPRAEKEYQSAYLWYEEQQQGLGERFAISVRSKLAQIAAFPFSYSKRKSNLYETSFGRPFPFVVIFYIDREQQQVIVVSIFHTSRNPAKKYKT